MAISIGGTVVIDNSRNINGVSVIASSFFDIPSGVTTDRPASPIIGDIRFNTESLEFETYQGSYWIGAGSTTVA